MQRPVRLVSFGLLIVLAGCASSQVSGPAKDIGSSVSALQTNLSNFGDAVKTEQTNESSISADNTVEANLAIASTKQIDTELQVRNAETPKQVLDILQTEGAAEVSAYTTPASTAPTAPTLVLPTDKLTAVSKSLTQIATPATTDEDLESTYNFALQVHQQMETLQAKAAPAQSAQPK